MRLKCLDIQGFKSFPDKINIGFDRGITAIVGPNGSGKSNVSDAIRWVLGEQSNKSLRSTRMEDVIFSGTAKRKPQGFAEVSLTIDNSDHALNVEYNEVMITRRYYRSGESEYFINKSPARLRDINELFMDTGLGRDGYSIIGQGTIDQILLGKSEERRSMLEEVAGISKFRYRKTEAERKLAATEENLIRLNDIVGELEERLPALERQAEKAKKYLTMYEEKKNLEISLWLEDLTQIKVSAQKIQEDHAIAKGQLDGLTVEVDNIEADITHLFDENIKINTELDQIRRQQSEWEEELSGIGSQKAVLESRAEFEEGVIRRLEQELTSVTTRREETENNIQEMNALIEAKTAEIAAVEVKIGEVFAEIEAITAQGEDNRRKAGELQAALQEIGNRRNRIQMEIISVRSTAESQQARIDELDESIKNQSEQNETLKNELEEIRASVSAKEEEKQGELNAAAGLQKMLEIKNRNYEQALEAEQRCANEKNALEQRSRILSEMEKHLEGFGGAVKAVLEQSRRGALQGIVGTVSQLIKVEEKYLIAVETALGAGIQNVVTKDSVSAKTAMLWLKNKNAGRATFLPLNSLTPKGVSENFKGKPGFIGVADELVETDSVNRIAIHFLLGRTLVCDHIDHALALAKTIQNRYKIVTLDGQVINPGGSMTGGSAAKNGGLLSRGIELEKIEKELVLKEEEYLKEQEKLDKASREKNALDARMETNRETVRALDEEIARLRGLCENKEVVLRSYCELNEGFQREKKMLLTVIEAADARIEELNREKESCDTDSDKLQTQLTSLQGLSNEDQAKMETLKQRSANYELEKVGYFKEIEGTKSLIGQLENQLKLIGAEAEEKTAQMADARQKIQSAKEEAANLEQQAEGLRTQQKESVERAQSLTDKRQEYEQKQTEYRQLQKEKSSAKERLIEEVSRLDNKLAGISEQSDRIIAQLLDVYELTVTDAKAMAQPLENATEAKKRVASLKGSIRALGSVNLESIEEFAAVKERYDFMSGQVNDLVQSKGELEKIIRELLSQMKDIFSEKFTQLNEEFQKIFAELFGGGTAQLILSDPEDVLNCDIDVKAAPPGKIIKNLVSLSGGERAFTAICLYFAILKIRPTPFCVVDEIEAALDDVNVTRFASYMRHYCENTQFVCITHRRGTMEEADVLYGVTMPEQGISKLLTINVNEIAEQLKI